MSASSAAPVDDDAPDLAEDRVKARAAEREAMLRRLADIGMEMAEALAEELRDRRAAPPDNAGTRPSVADLSLAFNRVSRAVRQTLALEARLQEGALTRARAANDPDDNGGYYPGSPKWAEWSAEQARKIRAKIMAVAVSPSSEERAEREAAERAGYQPEPDEREKMFDRPDQSDFIDKTPEEMVEILNRALRIERNRRVFAEALAEQAQRELDERDGVDQDSDGENQDSTGPP